MEEKSGSEPIPQDEADAFYFTKTFPCGKAASMQCTSPREYCLISEVFETKIELTAECREVPADCTKAACIIEDAKSKFKNTGNCQIGTYYNAVNGKKTLKCYSR